MVEPASRIEDRFRAWGSQLARFLQRQQALDRPSYRLEHVLTLAFAACGGARGRVSNFLHGTWLGHPLHPALTALPTGAIGASVALDGASLLPGHSAEFRHASRLALGVGIVGSVGAWLTGLTDWQHTHLESRRVGLVHGALNSVATALYVSSWWDRRRGRHIRGMASSALGYGITLSSGYLGAWLVFSSGIGVNQARERLALRRWTPVLSVSALDGRPQRVEVDGVGLVLYRSGDEVLAAGERCPHLGAPMRDGWVDRGQIVCPWHGSRFAPTSGEVRRGPATAPLPCYQTRIRDGVVEVAGAT